MRLIVITPEHTVNNEPEIANALFRVGLQRLHLRKPLFDKQAYKEYIAAIDPAFHSQIVIHGCFHLFHALQLAGIHLNSMVRNNIETWRAIKDIAPETISTSFHSWDEIIDNEFHYGYVFISPMFDSISKQGYMGSIQLDGINEVRKKLGQSYSPQIVGLGGVNKGTVLTLQNHGFDGAALLGAIWNTADPVAAYIEIANAIQ